MHVVPSAAAEGGGVLRIVYEQENRGVGRTDGTERTATMLKTVKVLGAANSVGVCSIFFASEVEERCQS